MIEITDINDSRISFYKSLRKTPPSHLENNIFVAEGEKVFEKLLNSEIEIQSIFALPDYYAKYNPIIMRKNVAPENQFTATAEFMKKIVGFRLHSGVMAIGRIPAPTPAGRLGPRIMMMNGIIDSENVGAIVRNCAAFGIDSVVCDKATSWPWLRRAVRVSMGAVFDMKVCRCDDLHDVFHILRSNGLEIIAAEIAGGSIPIDKFIFPSEFALIAGAEGPGIDNKILGQCDRIVHIPITEKVPSINVAAATAIFLQKAVQNF